MDATQLLQRILDQQVLIVQKLYDVERALHPMVRANVIEMYIIKNGEKKRVTNMLVKIGDVYELECLPKFDDGAGNLIPAKIDKVPAWLVSDESLAKIEVDSNNAFKAKVTILSEGNFLAQAKCDVDRGEAEKFLIGEIAFEVAGAEATVIAMSVTKFLAPEPTPVEPVPAQA